MSTHPYTITARYLVETPQSLEMAAEMIAGEQSSGTFVAVPGETEELKKRSRARVTGIKILETVAAPSLPGSRGPKKQPNTAAASCACVPSTSGSGGHGSEAEGEKRRYQRGEVTIEFPFENVGPNLPTLLATVCGNLYELSEVSGLKLLDLDFPQPFAERYPGPAFGIEGTRRLAGVENRPILGTIIKPSVGLRPQQAAELVRELAEAGIDFIKDDELMANPPHSPLKERVQAVMKEINRVADRTGKKVMYAVNITDELDAMLRHHDQVMEAGGTCVMVSINSVGLPGVNKLRQHSQLPIHGHRNGWGLYARHPMLGIEFTAYQKLWRIAGVDHLHVNGLRNKFWEPDDSVVRSMESMMKPLFGGYHAMPVISSGQWGGQAPETYRRTKTQDVMYLAGGGIMAHPGGPAAGLRAIQQAWQAAVAGVPLEDYAKTHSELMQSLQRFS